MFLDAEDKLNLLNSEDITDEMLAEARELDYWLFADLDEIIAMS